MTAKADKKYSSSNGFKRS